MLFLCAAAFGFSANSRSFFPLVRFLSLLVETMDMDLVDDLELLDDYDDLEFDRFGGAAGDTSGQVRRKGF